MKLLDIDGREVDSDGTKIVTLEEAAKLSGHPADELLADLRGEGVDLNADTVIICEDNSEIHVREKTDGELEFILVEA